ncbi:MAG TPA: hypothetical protein VHN17_11925 [Steroidobacteraceae bacterium]|jgi:hypothetical protein|nr:hypothetical protein [Steroidobacteraceae bacterium]
MRPVGARSVGRGHRIAEHTGRQTLQILIELGTEQNLAEILMDPQLPLR